MKYRIVQYTNESNDIYYVIEVRRFWWWWEKHYDKIDEYNLNKVKIDSVRYSFNNVVDAEQEFQRLNKVYNYRGIKIYPTIDEKIYYVLDWSQKSKARGYFDCYSFLIYGTYQHCCFMIDKKLKENGEQLYTKKIIKEIEIK